MTIENIILIGCGKLGRAMLTRWRESGIAKHIHVVAPNHSEQNAPGINWHRDPATLPVAANTAIVFAVKPALLSELLPAYAKQFGAIPLYLSVAAGKTLSFYRQHLGDSTTVVRTMPNTPGLIGQGVTALCAPTLQPADRATATTLMAVLGHTVWVEDESQMDAVSAISGCGPAYYFLFTDALARAGIEAGLPANLATELALHTATGSTALAAQSDRPLPELWAQVASPGGMTQAALDVLSAPAALPDTLKKAVAAAITRAKELANK